jgi:hypothetical protein
MLSAVASATQDSRFERLKNLKPPALPGDSYFAGLSRRRRDQPMGLRQAETDKSPENRTLGGDCGANGMRARLGLPAWVGRYCWCARRIGSSGLPGRHCPAR